MARHVPLPSARRIDSYLSGFGEDVFCQIQHSHVAWVIPTPWIREGSCACDDGYVMLDTHMAGWDERYNDWKQTMVCLKEDTIYPMPPSPANVLSQNNSVRRECREGEIAGDDEYGHWFCGSWGGTTPPPKAVEPVAKVGDTCGQNASYGADLNCYCHTGFDWAAPTGTDCIKAAVLIAHPEDRKTEPHVALLPQEAPNQSMGKAGLIAATAIGVVIVAGVGALIYKKMAESAAEKAFPGE